MCVFSRLPEDSAFGVCLLAFLKFDRYKGQMSPKRIAHEGFRVSHLVATMIIHGLSHAKMSDLATQEE